MNRVPAPPVYLAVMGSWRKRRRLAGGLAALTAVSALGLAAVARGAGEIRSSVTCCTFDAASYDIAAGQVATFSNATLGTPHNVTANKRGPDGKALFRSATISGNRSGPVNGTQYLAPGSYTFFCTIHGPSMSSTLDVGAGTAVPRPRLSVRILSSRIAKVRNSRKLIVNLAGAGSNADGVTVKATVAGATIARKGGIDVDSGTRRQVSLPLTARGQRTLADRDRALVTVTGAVPFGKAAVAHRPLT
jgi:plastocyanin